VKTDGSAATIALGGATAKVLGGVAAPHTVTDEAQVAEGSGSIGPDKQGRPPSPSPPPWPTSLGRPAQMAIWVSRKAALQGVDEGWYGGIARRSAASRKQAETGIMTSDTGQKDTAIHEAQLAVLAAVAATAKRIAEEVPGMPGSSSQADFAAALNNLASATRTIRGD
jgi:hypothetical protein